jgi:hypothetical protein
MGTNAYRSLAGQLAAGMCVLALISLMNKKKMKKKKTNSFLVHSDCGYKAARHSRLGEDIG